MEQKKQVGVAKDDNINRQQLCQYAGNEEEENKEGFLDINHHIYHSANY